MRSLGRALSVASVLVKSHINVKAGEEVLVLTDTEVDLDFAYAIVSACRFAGAEVTLLTIPPTFLEARDRSLTQVAREALKGAQVYIPMTPTTGHSVHDPQVAEQLGQRKLRFFVVGGWHGGQLDQAISALRLHNYDEVYRNSKKLCEFLEHKKEVRVKSKQGTDFTASIDGIFGVKGPYKWEGGVVHEGGELASFPGGEAWGGPREGTMNGTIVIDGPISGVCNNPNGASPAVKLTVKNGTVTRIEGGWEAKYIEKLMLSSENGNNMAEVAFGTNPYVNFTGNIDSNDKKKYGTAHVALGDNVFQIYPFGTKSSPIHIDMLIKEPEVYADGQLIIDDGNILALNEENR